MAAAAILNFSASENCTFRHVGSLMLQLGATFDSTISFLYFIKSTHICTRRLFDDVTRINFLFRFSATRSSPYGRDASSCQILYTDMFRNSKQRPASYRISTVSEFGVLWRDDGLVLKLCTKFGSNISYCL